MQEKRRASVAISDDGQPKGRINMASIIASISAAIGTGTLADTYSPIGQTDHPDRPLAPLFSMRESLA